MIIRQNSQIYDREDKDMHNVFYPKQINKAKVKILENQCFFAMPFSDDYNNVYDTISIYLERDGYSCMRVDKNSAASVPIINLILNGIAESQYIIVDISETNANVFYELGVTHTIKEYENVFIIKEKNSKTPFDIQHLQYIGYDKNNLKALSTELLSRLKANQYKNVFKNIIVANQLVKYQDLDEFLNYINHIFSEEQIKTYSFILDNSLAVTYSKQEIVNAIWDFDKILYREIKNEESKAQIDSLFNLFSELLLKVCDIDEIAKYIDEFMQGNAIDLDEKTLLQYKTDLSIKLAEHGCLLNISLRWIIGYFQRSKSTNIDLNRYKLEAFLLKSDSEKINEYIINSITSDNNYIREHMADIVGEKKLHIAEDALIVQLKRENNIYTVASIVEALGKIHSIKSIDVINEYLEKEADALIKNQNYFVLKHIRNALVKIDPQDALIKFDNKFFEILVKNITI